MIENLPCGICNQTEFINGVEFESRTYDYADSTFIRSLAFTGSDMISGGHMTVIDDIVSRQRLFREDLHFYFQSPATGGKSALECGPFDPQSPDRETDESWLSPQYHYMELAICYKKLIKTWKQSQLRPGIARAEENTSLNDWVMMKMLESGNRNYDHLIWKGDYGSGDQQLSHFDGLIKKIFNRLNTAATHEETFQFTGLQAGDSIEGLVAGVTINVPFDTDNDTTVANLAADLIAVQDPYGNAVFTIGVAGDTVTVTNNKVASFNRVSLFVTDGTGVDFLCNQANNAGNGTLVYNEVIPVSGRKAPVSIPLTTLTKNNIIDQMEALYLQVNSQNCEIFDYNPTLHISKHAYGLLQAALVDLGVGALSDVFSEFGRKTAPFDFNIHETRYLPNDAMVLMDNGNAFFGTNLLADHNDIKTWVDNDCQQVRMRAEMTGGVGIGNYGEVACNFDGAAWTFLADEPFDSPQ